MRKIVNYLPAALLSMILLTNGFQAIRLSDESMSLVLLLGFGATFSSALLLVVGVCDCSVAALILFKDTFWPGVKRRYLFVYAGLWPAVPRILESYRSGLFPLAEIIFFITLSAVAFYLEQKRTLAQASLEDDIELKSP